MTWNDPNSLVPERGPVYIKCPLILSVFFQEVDPLGVSKIPGSLPYGSEQLM